MDNLVLATGKYEQPRVLSTFLNLKFRIFLADMIIQWHFMSTIILGNIDLIYYSSVSYLLCDLRCRSLNLPYNLEIIIPD